jgi:UDP-N-acetylglucosamine--N-acetylmuramyl-(pentapeptide) pyrophosphoryl-undecaprenol N-acetylglucosamine transferase
MAQHPETLATAAHAAWNCGRPNAARDLADLVESFGGAAMQDVIRVDQATPKKAAARATAAHREIEDTIFGPLAQHLEQAAGEH